MSARPGAGALVWRRAPPSAPVAPHVLDDESAGRTVVVRPSGAGLAQCDCETWKQATSYWETAAPFAGVFRVAPLPAHTARGAHHMGRCNRTTTKNRGRDP